MGADAATIQAGHRSSSDARGDHRGSKEALDSRMGRVCGQIRWAWEIQQGIRRWFELLRNGGALYCVGNTEEDQLWGRPRASGQVRGQCL